MSQLSVAHKFLRADVDTFLDEIDAELYQEWQDFFLIQSGGYRLPEKEQTPEQVETNFKLWAGMHNASLRAKNGRK